MTIVIIHARLITTKTPKRVHRRVSKNAITSYPGNNILTEDLGFITENNNCKSCSRLKGKRFKVVGRIKDSEVRGCSDV